MSQITWNDSYSVNNAEIDAQHKEWIAIYNRLDHILLNGNSQELLTAATDAIQAMYEYAGYHFRQEEQYMEKLSYPHIVEHKRLHTEFDDQLYNYSRGIRTGKLILNTEVLSILKNWLVHHILHEDQKYCAFSTQK